MSPRKNVQGFLFMVNSALLFSFMGAMAHFLCMHFDWQVVAFFRNFIATVFAFAFLGSFSFESREYRNAFVWFRCLIGGCGVISTFYALSHTSISVVVSIMNTAPIWVTLIRRVFYRDRVPPMTWLMIAVGVAGVGFIEAPSFDNHYLPLLAANLSALISALVQIFLHELSDIDSRKVVFLFSLIATLISVGLLAVVPPALSLQPFLDAKLSMFLIGMGVFGYGGQMAMTRAFAVGHPTVVSLAALWNVLFTLVLDAVFFGRVLTLGTIAGIACIVLSSTVIRNRME